MNFAARRQPRFGERRYVQWVCANCGAPLKRAVVGATLPDVPPTQCRRCDHVTQPEIVVDRDPKPARAEPGQHGYRSDRDGPI